MPISHESRFIVAILVVVPLVALVNTLIGCYSRYRVKVDRGCLAVLTITRFIFHIEYSSRTLSVESVSSDFDGKYTVRIGCRSASGRQVDVAVSFKDDEDGEKEFKKFMGLLQRALKGGVD